MESEGVREFLFALPRFATDEKDRVAANRRSKIGTIEVVRKHATYVGEVYDHLKVNQFEQANKKDAFGVTQGRHTMSTTKKGNLIKKHNSYGRRSQYNVGKELGRLSVFYHMGHTLQACHLIKFEMCSYAIDELTMVIVRNHIYRTWESNLKKWSGRKP